MTAQTCHTCHTPIPAGLAVQRSILFQPRAWCRHCWELRLAVEAAFPEQRRPIDERIEA